MRLLLLFSAFLAALTGVAIGSSANAQPLQASVSVAQPARPGDKASATRPVDRQKETIGDVAWRSTPASEIRASRPIYADRLRV